MKKGWKNYDKFQSKRHSNAVKFGSAGGKYAGMKPKHRFQSATIDKLSRGRTAHALAVDKGLQATKVYENPDNYMKSQRNRTDLDDYDTLEGLSEVERKRLLKLYRQNEAKNYHSENAVMLIERFGTDAEKKKAREYYAKVEKIGSVPYEINTWFYEHSNKYYPKLRGE